MHKLALNYCKERAYYLLSQAKLCSIQEVLELVDSIPRLHYLLSTDFRIGYNKKFFFKSNSNQNYNLIDKNHKAFRYGGLVRKWAGNYLNTNQSLLIRFRKLKYIAFKHLHDLAIHPLYLGVICIKEQKILIPFYTLLWEVV